MLTDQDALSLAKQLLPVRHSSEDEAYMMQKLMALYQQGVEAGTKRDVKEMYWEGVKAGAARYAWIAAPTGIRYVGCVASPTTALTVVLAQIEKEKQEALGS